MSGRIRATVDYSGFSQKDNTHVTSNVSESAGWLAQCKCTMHNSSKLSGEADERGPRPSGVATDSLSYNVGPSPVRRLETDPYEPWIQLAAFGLLGRVEGDEEWANLMIHFILSSPFVCWVMSCSLTKTHLAPLTVYVHFFSRHLNKWNVQSHY